MHRPPVRAQRSRPRCRSDRRAGADALTGPPSLRSHLVLAGVSTRAAAHSAARAGLEVTAIDAFADRDQHRAVTAHAVPQGPAGSFSARAVAEAACRVAGDAVMYLSPFENHPAAVARLARGRQLWGNAPGVLRRVRDPRRLSAALRDAGLRAPDVAETPEEAAVVRDWVQKPRRSGGGRGVRAWIPGTPLGPGTVLQERIEGHPCSVVFVAAGGRAVPIGLSHQLVGDSAFGAQGFEYCGSILPPDDDPVLGRAAPTVSGAARLSEVVSATFGLVGVNGIDFIATAEGPVAVEVNPRWCASMELVDRASDVPVLAVHVNACSGAGLSGIERAGRERLEAHGKAVLYARTAVIVGNTDGWLADPAVGDVPWPGTRIEPGSPVCTVFASGRDAPSCRAALARRAADIYAVLATWRIDEG